MPRVLVFPQGHCKLSPANLQQVIPNRISLFLLPKTASGPKETHPSVIPVPNACLRDFRAIYNNLTTLLRLMRYPGYSFRQCENNFTRPRRAWDIPQLASRCNPKTARKFTAKRAWLEITQKHQKLACMMQWINDRLQQVKQISRRPSFFPDLHEAVSGERYCIRNSYRA